MILNKRLKYSRWFQRDIVWRYSWLDYYQIHWIFLTEAGQYSYNILNNWIILGLKILINNILIKESALLYILLQSTKSDLAAYLPLFLLKSIRPVSKKSSKHTFHIKWMSGSPNNRPIQQGWFNVTLQNLFFWCVRVF